MLFGGGHHLDVELDIRVGGLEIGDERLVGDVGGRPAPDRDRGLFRLLRRAATFTGWRCRCACRYQCDEHCEDYQQVENPFAASEVCSVLHHVFCSLGMWTN